MQREQKLPEQSWICQYSRSSFSAARKQQVGHSRNQLEEQKKEFRSSVVRANAGFLFLYGELLGCSALVRLGVILLMTLAIPFLRYGPVASDRR